MSEVKLMTQAEYAAHRGCSAVAVFKAVRDKRISLVHDKIDPVVADIEWEANTRARAAASASRSGNELPPHVPSAAPPAFDAPAPPSTASSKASPTDDSYMQNRTRREAAEANIAEIKLAEMQGRMLQKAEVDAAVFEIARAMRDGLVNCSKRIAADVATLTDVEACEAVIEREHRALLTSMTKSLAAMTATDPIMGGEPK